MKKLNRSKLAIAATGLAVIIMSGCASNPTERLDALDAAVAKAQADADAAMSAAQSAQSDAASAQSAASAAQDSANEAVTTSQRLTESCCRK